MTNSVMYEYRELSPEEQRELMRKRKALGYPPHSPPHVAKDRTFYLLTAACYQHKQHLRRQERRHQLMDELFATFVPANVELRGWVILPNHYHLLVRVPDFDMLGGLFRRVHGRTSRFWNQDDGVTGRKVWYRYSDRAIRSERHYYTTLNYIHYNPVKHACVESPYAWNTSSVHWYREHFGREWLRETWVHYPIRDYGQKWDK